jgi:vacuolar protein sorting-associated protein 26
VDFKDEKGRRYHKTAVVKGKNGETEELPLYTNHDNIFGEVRSTPPAAAELFVHKLQLQRLAVHTTTSALLCSVLLQVRITPLTTKRVEHSGIKVQLIGQIELASERGSPHDFVSLGKQQGHIRYTGLLSRLQ